MNDSTAYRAQIAQHADLMDQLKQEDERHA